MLRTCSIASGSIIAIRSHTPMPRSPLMKQSCWFRYFLKNRHRFAYTTMVGLGLPRGSGAVESAIRRVINLRIKGASIYWLPESVDAILLLRSFYKSGRWNCLQRMAMTPVGVSA